MANFKDIIGQKQAKEHFQTAIETGNISHAYIINGETGSGRRMLADAFAKAPKGNQKHTIKKGASAYGSEG